jgi:hypothetical protein
MTDALASTSCARLPAASLGRLGALRACPDLRALAAGEHLWLFWPAGQAELARAILAVGGAELLSHEAGTWRRLGAHLPAFDVPDPAQARALSSLLFPAPVTPVPPGERAWQPVALTLVRDASPRAASALRVSLGELGRWADGATTHALEAVQGAVQGDEVLLRGPRLPALRGERYWGQQILLPLGYRAEPALAEGVLRSALGLQAGEVALLTHEGAEVIPQEAFGPVTRAAVRLAVARRSSGEGAPA